MILERVLATIRRHGMLETGDRVLVAVSGGPDSLALLHVLRELSEDLPLSLVVTHLDHALRGEAGEEDRRFVERVAASLGLEVVAAREDVAALARREKRSLEEAGRIARRRFFRETAAKIGARRVALGHHRDDQAESVLLRLVAGSGRGGLSGIRPVGEGLFVRPLLDCGREEILAYLSERGIEYRVDASNEEIRFPRNRLRHRVLPLLRAEFNPRVGEAIARTAEILREEDELLDLMARRDLERLLLEPARASRSSRRDVGVPDPPSIVLDAAGLAALPRPIALRALRLALRRAGLRGRDLARERIEELLSLAARGGSNLDLSPGGGITARLEYGRLILQRSPIARDRPGGERSDGVRLEVPGEVLLEELGLRIAARVVEREAVPAGFPGAPGERAYFDAESLAAPILVRPSRPGDRMRSLGTAGTRKLSDILTDLKVPREARRRAVVVTVGGEIVWLVGMRTSARFHVTDRTRSVVVLEADHPGLPPPLYTPAEIRATVERLAGEIRGWAAGDEVTVLGILQGSFVFLADLIREIPHPLRVSFVDRQGHLLSGDLPLDGARVLLVEDILDSGESLARVLDAVRARGPAEVRTCVLFDKPSGRRLAIEADFRGLIVPDRWVVGFGLDLDHRHRNLPYLTWVSPNS
jgi:tRNA(Ile)-lysidine synthase